ncbi:arginase [Clostridium hydrogenum]|uniref:arginase n=1 Tax=Clostridium hydrogenum TaxID=2855764 RepID=UPI001F211109|nr:arginase [Clostridium hydrogenum]
MVKTLLSIDWDYFIPIKREWCGSYYESVKNIQAIWYKRYFKSKEIGQDIVKEVVPGNMLNVFWRKAKDRFNIKKNINVYVTDSHKWSYDIAKENNCNYVINIDAHSDLGYEGLNSFMFEVNCSNWLGKLLYNKIAKKSLIMYSPYTYEDKNEFEVINKKFQVNYVDFNTIKKDIDIDTIHICRSGMWTPPWLDERFYSFANEIEGEHIVERCPYRKWQVNNITLSEKLDYLYCS